MLKCDKCGGAITEGSTFCPHCADPVTTSDKPESALAGSATAIVNISFGYSSSPNYNTAVDLCTKLPSYTASGEDKEIRHSIALAITEIELLIKLYELVGGWKTSSMLINGQAATKSALVYHGAGCFRSRQKAYNRQMHCFGEQESDFNIWGCKRLNMPFMWGKWLTYGQMNRQGVWFFDKDRIIHDIELAVHENGLCPVLDRSRILDTLDKIPDSVSPKSDPNWEYLTEYEETSDGDYQNVAIGVRPQLKKAPSYVVGEFRPVWKLEDDTLLTEGAAKQSNTIKFSQKSSCALAALCCCICVALVAILAI